MTGTDATTPAAATVITEQDLINSLRPQYEFYDATGDTAKKELILAVGFDLADRLTETNGWDAAARKAFIHRLFK